MHFIAGAFSSNADCGDREKWLKGNFPSKVQGHLVRGQNASTLQQTDGRAR